MSPSVDTPAALSHTASASSSRRETRDSVTSVTNDSTESAIDFRVEITKTVCKTQTIITVNGEQVRLDATETWTIVLPNGGGQILIHRWATPDIADPNLREQIGLHFLVTIELVDNIPSRP